MIPLYCSDTTQCNIDGSVSDTADISLLTLMHSSTKAALFLYVEHLYVEQTARINIYVTLKQEIQINNKLSIGKVVYCLIHLACNDDTLRTC